MDALQTLEALERGQLVADPFAGRVLAGFGTDVIEVENVEGGDPLRRWRVGYRWRRPSTATCVRRVIGIADSSCIFETSAVAVSCGLLS